MSYVVYVAGFAVTVTSALAEMPLYEAVTVADPSFIPFTVPLSAVRTEGSDELHVQAEVMSVLSIRVPSAYVMYVAVNFPELPA